MPQLSLFGSAPVVLADGDLGRIVYEPGVVDSARCGRWFAELREAVEWKAERRQMYDREVDVPRLTSHCHLRVEEELRAAPAAIAEAARLVVETTQVPFNSVGLNLYRDGKDSVAPHNDHLTSIVKGFPITLLSLGATRRMTIRAREPPRRVVHVDLEPGSLLTMSWTTQLHYTHAVPKTGDAVGERISLAFRVRPGSPDTADEHGYR